MKIDTRNGRWQLSVGSYDLIIRKGRRPRFFCHRNFGYMRFWDVGPVRLIRFNFVRGEK